MEFGTATVFPMLQLASRVQVLFCVHLADLRVVSRKKCDIEIKVRLAASSSKSRVEESIDLFITPSHNVIQAVHGPRDWTIATSIRPSDHYLPYILSKRKMILMNTLMTRIML